MADRVKHSLKVKMFLTFLASSLIMISLSVLYISIQMSTTAKTNVLKSVSEIVRERTQNWNDLCYNFEKYGTTLTHNANTRETLLIDSEDNFVLNNMIANFINDYNSMLDLVISRHRFGMNSFFVVNEHLPIAKNMLPGKTVTQSATMPSIYSTSGLSNAGWLKDALKKNGNVHVFYTDVDDETGTNVIFAQVILNQSYENDAEYLGMQMLSFDIINILNDFERIAIEGVKVLVNNQNGGSWSNFQGEIGDGYYEVVSKIDWGLDITMYIPHRATNINLKDIFENSWVYLFIAIGMSLMLSLILGFRLSRPILKLTEEIKNINWEGDTNAIREYKGKDYEIKYLYNSFNIMVEKTKKLMDQISEDSNKRLKLEMKMYQYQINPHMLYNSLDSISWKALMVGQPEIAQMNKNLADIFKYVISGGEIISDLENEIEYADKYLEIQRIRYACPIELHTEISDEDKKIRLPKCTLQPIVENCVTHAIGSANGTLTIKISTSLLENGEKILRISDNGTLGGSKQINELLKSEKDDNLKFGIKNVNERLKRYFDHSIWAEESDSGGVTIIIKLGYEGEK